MHVCRCLVKLGKIRVRCRRKGRHSDVIGDEYRRGHDGFHGVDAERIRKVGSKGAPVPSSLERLSNAAHAGVLWTLCRGRRVDGGGTAARALAVVPA